MFQGATSPPVSLSQRSTPFARVALPALVIILCLLSAGVYTPLRFHSLMGDDLVSLVSLRANSHQNIFDRVFIHSLYGVYRPVDHLYMFLRAELFGTEYSLYFFSNLLLLFLNIYLLFKLLHEVSSGTWLLPVLLVYFYSFHRFQNYAVLNRHGGEELFMQMIFILLLYLLFNYYKNPSVRNALAILGGYLISVFTRENLIFAAPGLVLLFLLIRRTSAEQQFRVWPKLKINYLLSSLPLLVALFYVIIRHLVLGGTTRHIPGALIQFDALANLKSYAILFLDIFQLMLNEPWLSGIAFRYIPLALRVLTAGFALLSILLVVYFLAGKRVRRGDKGFMIVLLAICLCLIIPGAMVVKNDPKYVEFSYLSYAVALTFLFARVPFSKPRKGAILSLMAVSIVSSCAFYLTHIGGVSWYYSSKFTDNLKSQTIDQYGNSLRQASIWIPDNYDVKYALLGSSFFQLYLNDPTYKIHYYTSQREIGRVGADTLVFAFDWSHREFQDMTPVLRSFDSTRVVRYDFIANFKLGSITSDPLRGNERGRTVFLMPQEIVGRKIQSLVIVSPYAYAYDTVDVHVGDRLAFLYRILYGQSDGLGLEISAVGDGMPVALYRNPKISYSGGWIYQEVKLAGLPEGRYRFDFRVFSPSGDYTGDWLAMVNLVLASEK